MNMSEKSKETKKELLSLEEIKEIQLEILDYVHEFCQKKGYEYFLTGGTLIGAIRHQGYIPWDDDIDIMMYRDVYDSFIRDFNESQSRYHAYSLADEGCNSPFCKVADADTFLIEDILVNDFEIGVNIDLFPLDKYPVGQSLIEDSIMSSLHKLDKKMFGKAFRMNRIHERPLRQRALIAVWKLWGIFETKRSLGEKQRDIACAFAKEETSRYAPLVSQIRTKFPVIDRENNVQIDAEFEGRTYKIPSQYDEYLTMMYGDYMELPPEDKRTSGHSFCAWRINRIE